MQMSTNHVLTCTQYTKTQTRLVRIHIISRIQQMLILVVVFTTLPICSTELIVPMFDPPHTRLALNGFQASYYSHHSSQYALWETNWLFRVSGCNPYLESLLNYRNGTPPWTPTNRGHGITSRPTEAPPWGLT